MKMKNLFKMRFTKVAAVVLAAALTVSVYMALADFSERQLTIVSVQVSSTLGGNMGPQNLINNAKDDMFSSANDANAWVYIELDDVYAVSQVKLWARGDKYGFPNTIRVDSSIDGISWAVVPGAAFQFPHTGNYITNVENPLVFGSPVNAKYVRIVTTDSFYDGTSSLTQYAEIEAFGDDSSYTGDDMLQNYKIKRIGPTNTKWFQFEDVAILASYPSDAFFVQYYRTPIAGDTQTRAPAAVQYNGKWLLAYERGAEGSTEIYSKLSDGAEIESFYGAESKLVNKTNWDAVKCPSFVKVGSDTYLACEVVKSGVSKIAMVKYTGQSNITFTSADVLNFAVSVPGFSGNMCRPSLTYDGNTGKLRLYFVNYLTAEQPVMYYAESTDGTPANLQYVAFLDNLRYGTVFHSAGGYFSIAKTYFDDGSTMTEWQSSADGVAFGRESTLLDYNYRLNGTFFSTGLGAAAIDHTGKIAGIFAEVFDASPVDGAIMLALPQMRVTVSKGQTTLAESIAISAGVQALRVERDYTSTDRVSIFDKPSETAGYELRVNILAGTSYQIMPITQNGAARTTVAAYKNPAISDLTWIKPTDAAGTASFPVYRADNVLAYDENVQWQSPYFYTYNQTPDELVVTLPAALNVGAVSFAGNVDGGGFPLQFRVLTSTDNITFTPVTNARIYDTPAMSSSGDYIVRFDNTVNARYVKFVFERTSLNSAFMLQTCLSKVKIYGKNVPAQYVYDPATIVRGFPATSSYPGGKTLVAIPGSDMSVTASSFLDNSANWKPENLLDSTDTLWCSQSDASGELTEILTFKLDKAGSASFDVGRIELVPRIDGSLFPKNFKFAYSNDGTNFTDIPGLSYIGYSVPDVTLHQYFTLATPVSAKYIRVYIDKQRSDGNFFMTQLSEVIIDKVV